MNNLEFIENIATNVSWTSDLYRDRISYYDQLLPHVLMCEMSTTFLSISDETFIHKLNVEENLVKLKIFLELIENGLNSNSSEVKNLILVSFIENVAPYIKYFSSIQTIIGNSLKEELESLQHFL